MALCLYLVMCMFCLFVCLFDYEVGGGFLGTGRLYACFVDGGGLGKGGGGS